MLVFLWYADWKWLLEEPSRYVFLGRERPPFRSLWVRSSVTSTWSFTFGTKFHSTRDLHINSYINCTHNNEYCHLKNHLRKCITQNLTMWNHKLHLTGMAMASYSYTLLSPNGEVNAAWYYSTLIRIQRNTTQTHIYSIWITDYLSNV